MAVGGQDMATEACLGGQDMASQVSFILIRAIILDYFVDVMMRVPLFYGPRQEYRSAFSKTGMTSKKRARSCRAHSRLFQRAQMRDSFSFPLSDSEVVLELGPG